MPRTLLQALLFLLGFWAALTVVGPLGVARGDGSQPDPELSALETTLHDSVNGVRRGKHRIPLHRDPALDRVARRHSDDMARRGFFAHVNPEGLDPVGRLRHGRVDGFSLAGENVGRTNQTDPNHRILEGWLRSPVHRENLLAPAFNRAGLGIVRARDGTLYYTQIYVTIPADS